MLGRRQFLGGRRALSLLWNHEAPRYFHSSSLMARKQTVEDLAKAVDLKGQRVLVRADLNVPISKKENMQKITDDTRIRSSLPTIQLLMDQGAKVILCSHLGRPDGKVVETLRLDPVATRLSELLDRPVKKVKGCVGPDVEKEIESMTDGDVVLLENVRFHPGEEENDPDFAAQLASLANIYVNDAFGTAHRAHASTEGVTKHVKHKVAGFLMEKELKYLSGVIDNPKRPLAAIIGGGKVSSKLPLLQNLINKVDKVLIGGGMVFTLYRAQGYNTGKSLVDEKLIEQAAELLKTAEEKGVKILLPTDIVVAESYTPEASHKVVPGSEIPENWTGMDVGPETVRLFKRELSECKTIIWNGPMGVFEFEKFAAGTNHIAALLGELTKRGAITVIGGGDSIAAVEDAGVAKDITHISTGGGASLEMLEGKELPGVACLDEA